MSHLFVLVRMTAHITIRGRNKFATSPSVLCSVLLFLERIINQRVEGHNIFQMTKTMIEKMADDLIGQMTEARLIDKDMEERYIYVFICWIEKFITVGSIIVISLAFHKLFPTIFFLVFFLELRKRTGGYHLDKYYKCYLATVVSYLVIVIISARLSEHPQWLFAILVIAITGIGLIGTVNHPNMHMTSEELMESKKSARTIVLLEGCIILGCVLLDADMVYISYMAIAVILCAALLCIAKIFKQEVRENEAG